MLNLVKTTCANTFIEEIRVGYVRYRDIRTKERWEVLGVCDKRAHCCVGLLLDTGEVVTDLERAKEVALAYKGLDSPVRPTFKGCCPFTFNILEPLKDE